MKRVINTQDKKFSYSISLTGYQIEWIANNPTFRLSSFIRHKLDQYIIDKESLKVANEQTTN